MLGRLANCLLPHILRGRSVYQLRMIRYHYGHNVIMLYIGSLSISGKAKRASPDYRECLLTWPIGSGKLTSGRLRMIESVNERGLSGVGNYLTKVASRAD